MKYRTTKKAIRGMSDPVYCVGYANLQNLLRFVDPFAYSTRAEGWACDYYSVGNVIISTGYSPIGRKTDYNLCHEYDQKAYKILCDYSMKWEQQKEQIEALLEEFIQKLTKGKRD